STCPRSCCRGIRDLTLKEQLPMNIVLLAVLTALPALTESPIKVEDTDTEVQIDTNMLQAQINKKGYVSGIAPGSFLDRKTGARDMGFGLHIMDFLMAPGWSDDGYSRDPQVHGNLPKHYIEGPQICTQARQLQPELVRGKDFLAVRLRYRFTKPAPGLKA